MCKSLSQVDAIYPIYAWSSQTVRILLSITLDFYKNVTMVTFNIMALDFYGELMKEIPQEFQALDFQ